MTIYRLNACKRMNKVVKIILAVVGILAVASIVASLVTKYAKSK